MTRVRPRNRNHAPVGLRNGGVVNPGRHTRAEMIAEYRSYYQWTLEQAQAAIAVADDDLIVETYLGPWALKNMTEVTD